MTTRPGPARVTIVPAGPVMIEGPVEVVLADGTTVVSERPLVAICACRRSRHYPFCDTSHRQRANGSPQSVGNGDSSED